jgi:hypothetical protein
MPAARIGCQSPIQATTETANAAGSTLVDYCTAVQTAALDSSRPFAYYVDGRGARFPQRLTADSADGVHPSTVGHRKYGDAVITAMRSAGVL